MFVHTVIMVIEPHMKQGRQHKLISTIFLATSVTKKLDHNTENLSVWIVTVSGASSISVKRVYSPSWERIMKNSLSMLCIFCGIPITTSTGSTVPVTAFQSASPILTNREISTYIPSVRSGISLRYSFIPFSITLLSFLGTLPEISFTSTRISMFSPAATLFSCAGVSTAFTTAAVSDTPAVYSCSSQTTVTMTVPSP